MTDRDDSRTLDRRRFLVGGSAMALAATASRIAGGEPATERPDRYDRPTPDRTLLVRNIHTLVTMDDERREIHDAWLKIRGNVVDSLGDASMDPGTADDVLDLRGRHVVMPGMVNTHHHFYQTLTRVITPDGTLFPWLKSLYPIWANMRSNDIYLSAQLAAAELMLSGCTTSSDHLYIVPNDCEFEDEIRALADIGMRFTCVRGSMSIGESKGGLPPDSVVEDEDDILRDSQRLIEAEHDNSRHSMLRIALGPCSPFTISSDLMRESAALARNYPGVRLHTHLAENADDIAFMQETYGARPGEWTESVDWLDDDVWHAHVVHLNDNEIRMFAKAGTGGAHCPASNMRLASGAAPVRKMLDADMPLGLGVDGSASNDTSNLLQEARLALLLARVREVSVEGMTAREALEVATRGGARVLGRDDIGHLAPGMSADFISFDTGRREFVGAHADPVAAIVLCQTDHVDHSFINGRQVVDNGQITTIDYGVLAEKTRAAAIALANS